MTKQFTTQSIDFRTSAGLAIADKLTQGAGALGFIAQAMMQVTLLRQSVTAG